MCVCLSRGGMVLNAPPEFPMHNAIHPRLQLFGPIGTWVLAGHHSWVIATRPTGTNDNGGTTLVVI